MKLISEMGHASRPTDCGRGGALGNANTLTFSSRLPPRRAPPSSSGGARTANAERANYEISDLIRAVGPDVNDHLAPS